jgi:ABC-type transporter Mla MlaB component
MDDTAVAIKENSSTTEVVISGSMTIDRIEELRIGLIDAFNRGKKVQVSLEAVTEVDITGLQLLCSAHRTSIANGIDLSVAGGACEALSAVAGEAGMLRHIGCPQDTCGTCIWKITGVAEKEPQ